jgi:hypothetical protein
MLALWALAACYRPDPWTPPPPPPEALEAMGVGVLDPSAVAAGELGVEGAEAEAEGEAAEGAAPEHGDTEPGDADADAPDDTDAAETPPAPPFDAYAATVVSAPASIVDDFGKALFVILVPGTPVEVRGEDLPARKRVWCAKCEPQVEGWLQAHLVERDAAAE